MFLSGFTIKWLKATHFRQEEKMIQQPSNTVAAVALSSHLII